MTIIQMEDGPNGKRSHKYVLLRKYTVQYIQLSPTLGIRTILIYGGSTEP